MFIKYLTYSAVCDVTSETKSLDGISTIL